ncbi:UvrB/UvrC motif-containing protein [Ereboglobus luteus]|uniref:Excinuclease ABC subunit B n=1 Tax=Ereboglobus luteus TaxID=1796921 RepID=A0A2U8E324_9BACT|nr:UvrB/UvrC motif-containing protein [Ereboglobus luteus]AWI09221.1 excinuclease ABC subunit B [Ereboglobus luteus]
MANQLKCVSCGKPATVHFTQILNNKVHKVDLCEACAQEKGLTTLAGFELPLDLFPPKATSEPTAAAPESGLTLRCEKCGFTEADFKKTGRFGCPHCYETFKQMLGPMLDGMHKGTAHTGKVPRHAAARKEYHDRLSQLELTLASAIKDERYEDAARYRDEIAQVKQTYGKQEAAS